ncbi:hypothetical protein JOD54_002169 [Actinokineospora baliensis]|uniref:hypothetical protein n=1 Tax=Actinokineospora baliensis TaxID=547056 RepID=UPI00195CA50E|nr:hypothetical protein [Actinokineospora baliensis]MBM7771965.1 hypothetical protein [Actinokineospora baliensis]
MSSMEDLPRTEGTAPRVIDANHGLTTPPDRVFVCLDWLYVRGPGRPNHINGAGIDLSGHAPATLTHWVPTVSGDWVAIVNFGVKYADGRRSELWLREQMVPDYAIRRRPDRDG